MKTVILAGGMGTRLADETVNRPKPMVEIGGHPILWHIMSIYASYGFDDFIVCTGYKHEMIDEYVKTLPWKIETVNTGLNTLTAGRLLSIRDHIKDTFFMTYGDGLSDINIRSLLKYHYSHDGIATVTAVHPPGRFGVMHLDTRSDLVLSFEEKPQMDIGWINGGFFVLDEEVFYKMKSDVMFEHDPIESLVASKQIRAYKHEGYWQPMDTLRDKNTLEERWNKDAPWKRW
jgi:glucose-1-phosphate cytidylyltransferase